MLPDPGMPAAGRPAADSGPDADAVPSSAPKPFQEAISSLLSIQVRAEARVERIRPPQRLAPWSFAVAVDIGTAANPDCATGRLVVLYDPDGAEAWDGEIRLVAFASAELAPDMAGDPLLPAGGWSWLTESLEHHNAEHTAVGGTVTQTTSTRFGDLAGPHTTITVEVRASWTADSADMGPHLHAFVDLLCAAAGLPPEGVTPLAAH